MKYIALLRGINVGGKNKVSMSDLKDCFNGSGAENTQTYINSGNVVFDYSEKNIDAFIKKTEESIKAKFGFPVSLTVVDGVTLKEALESVPAWWGSDAESKHNAIFVIPPVTGEQVVNDVGDITEFEQIYVHKQIIFWSASLKHFSRTRWAKAFETKFYKHITIRNANTTKKLLELALR